MIDIGLIMFFIGFAFICYNTSISGIGEYYMEQNGVNFVEWLFNPKHILNCNVSIENIPRKLKFKKSKHFIYNFFEFIIHYFILVPHIVMYLGIILLVLGFMIENLF